MLGALIAFKKGDFSVRLPVNQVGLAGKIADTLNDIFELNENMAKELVAYQHGGGQGGQDRPARFPGGRRRRLGLLRRTR